jgi:WD40 repeat protein
MRDSTSHNASTKQSTTLLSSIGITTSVVAPRHGYEQVDAIFVGTSIGSILHVPLVDVAPIMPQRPTFLSMQWSLHALQALYRVPLCKREEFGRLVESAAKSNNSKSIQRNGIDLAAFYAASLPAKFLFPPIEPSIFVTSSLSHVGPLIDLQCFSSIDKSYENNVVVSCGTDGGISLHYYAPSSRNCLSSTKVLIPPYMECKFTSATKLDGCNISILAVGTDDGKIHLYNTMKPSQFHFLYRLFDIVRN